jgi:hypothetical protein
MNSQLIGLVCRCATGAKVRSTIRAKHEGGAAVVAVVDSRWLVLTRPDHLMAAFANFDNLTVFRLYANTQRHLAITHRILICSLMVDSCERFNSAHIFPVSYLTLALLASFLADTMFAK